MVERTGPLDFRSAPLRGLAALCPVPASRSSGDIFARSKRRMRLMRGDQVIPDTVDTHTCIMFGVHVDHAHTAHVCTTMQTAAVS